MRARALPASALVAILVVTGGLLASSVTLGILGGTWHQPNDYVIAVVPAAIGGLLAYRRPDNAVGWLLAASGALAAALSFSNLYAVYSVEHPESALPGYPAVGQIGTWFWIGSVTLLVLTVLLLPDGRLPGARWRPVAWMLITGGALVGFSEFVLPPDISAVDAGRVNPFEVPVLAPFLEPIFMVGAVMLLAGLACTAAAPLVRYVRATGVERQQLKWIAYGAVTAAVVLLTGTWTTQLPVVSHAVVGTVAITLVPLTVAFAVLRYRLYDIDRLISRTASYLIITLFLAGVYVAGVMGLGSIAQRIGGGSSSDLAVAGSTLAVAAMFGPLRRRTQQAVDHRFNRSRYDATQMVESFASRLRDQIDLSELQSGLRDVVAAAVQPSAVHVWLPADVTGENRPG